MVVVIVAFQRAEGDPNPFGGVVTLMSSSLQPNEPLIGIQWRTVEIDEFPGFVQAIDIPVTSLDWLIAYLRRRRIFVAVSFELAREMAWQAGLALATQGRALS